MMNLWKKRPKIMEEKNKYIEKRLILSDDVCKV